MIKVIAADMDGTLLNSGHTISEQTYQTIQDVQQGGIRFMIATGRDYPSASDTLKNFPLDCDGKWCRDPKPGWRASSDDSNVSGMF